jgi:phage terminase small subunit
MASKADKPRKVSKKTDSKKNPPPPPGAEVFDFSTLGIEGKFTIQQKRFIVYYTFPGDTFMNQRASAIKAGYKKESAVWSGYEVRRKPHVDAAINKILASNTVDIRERYQKALQTMDSRAFFNLADYVKKKMVTVKVGKDEYEEIEVEVFKDLSELTPEQLQAVDGIDYRGVRGSRVLVMADRGKTITDIINMQHKLNGITDDDDFDIEATADIIKGRLTQKITVRRKKEEIGKSADFIDAPKEQLVEEL